MATSIGAGYAQDITGIPAEYTNLLESLGYMNTPFQTQNQVFSSQENFQRILKGILDRQLSAYGNNAPGGNLAYLPLNMRNMFSAAAPVFNDPRYGISPGFFGGGYQQGQLPSNHPAAYEALLQQQGQVSPPSIGLPSQGASNSVPPPRIGTAISRNAEGPANAVNYGGRTYDLTSDAGRASMYSDAQQQLIPSGPGGTGVEHLIRRYAG
jgi:hypothetical protein